MGDRRRALSGSDDSTVRLWDVETGHASGVLEGHEHPVMVVAWGTDQRHVYSGDSRGGVRVGICRKRSLKRGHRRSQLQS